MNDLTKFVGAALSKSDRPELTAAKTVIAGGRGMGNGENFDMLYEVSRRSEILRRGMWIFHDCLTSIASYFFSRYYLTSYKFDWYQV